MQEFIEFSNSNSNVFEEKLGNTIPNQNQSHLTKIGLDEHTTSEIIETLDHGQYNQRDLKGRRCDKNKDDVKPKHNNQIMKEKCALDTKGSVEEETKKTYCQVIKENCQDVNKIHFNSKESSLPERKQIQIDPSKHGLHEAVTDKVIGTNDTE